MARFAAKSRQNSESNQRLMTTRHEQPQHRNSDRHDGANRKKNSVMGFDQARALARQQPAHEAQRYEPTFPK